MVSILLTRLELEGRYRAISARRDQMIADANAALGQMQEIQYWLGRLPEEKAESNVVTLTGQTNADDAA